MIRQFLTESLVLSFLGGGLGISVVALGLPPMMRMIAPGTIPLSDLVQLDRTVLLFSLALCCMTGVIFGLAPALQASRQGLNDKLKEGSRGSTTGAGRARQLMVVLEVALTLMLMTGGGLLIRTVRNLTNVNPGFAPQDVMTFSGAPRLKPSENRRVSNGDSAMRARCRCARSIIFTTLWQRRCRHPVVPTLCRMPSGGRCASWRSMPLGSHRLVICAA